MKNRTTYKDLPVVLTKDELLEISNEMSDKTLEIEEIETAKKRINPLREEITLLSQKFKNGYETKSVQCRVVFNEPTIGKKSIFRVDTNELVEVLNMEASEMQEDMNFNDEAVVEEARQIAEGEKQIEAADDAEIVDDDERTENANG